MNTTTRIVITIAVVALAALAFVARQNNKSAKAVSGKEHLVAKTSASSGTNAALAPAQTAKLPRLVDLGAGKCIPCRMMAPVLEELRKEYAGRMEVVFIDVWENPDAGKPYDIDGIPTQIFYDAEGKELFRHSGFFGKNDILAKWKELGFLRATNLNSTGTQQTEEL
jgi:thioredoxin 1